MNIINKDAKDQMDEANKLTARVAEIRWELENNPTLEIRIKCQAELTKISQKLDAKIKRLSRLN